jgi:hypothetical protein
MPTVLRIEGFRFFFYSDEHNPRHIHVEKGEAYARVLLETLEVTDTYKMSPKELKRVRRLVREYRNELMEAWNEYFRSDAN